MVIKPEFLNIMRCPACRGEIALCPDERGLRCEACRRIYPIRDGIPALMVEEATTDEPQAA